jgi:hypothetical protein
MSSSKFLLKSKAFNKRFSPSTYHWCTCNSLHFVQRACELLNVDLRARDDFRKMLEDMFGVEHKFIQGFYNVAGFFNTCCFCLITKIRLCSLRGWSCSWKCKSGNWNRAWIDSSFADDFAEQSAASAPVTQKLNFMN